MKRVTARELKNKTGEIVRRAREGERFLVTVRGKPAAAILPAKYLEKKKEKLRPAKEAWENIEETFKKSKPEFKTWQEAMAWVRKRA
jgi:prevent-host-death family protein